jgi:hypothetical protein
LNTTPFQKKQGVYFFVKNQSILSLNEDAHKNIYIHNAC